MCKVGGDSVRHDEKILISDKELTETVLNLNSNF
jgi:hypothetical protein